MRSLDVALRLLFASLLAMTEPTAIRALVRARLRDAFGAPNNKLGREDHWALEPGPYAPSVNVLIDPEATVPVVWIFDPHTKNDGVLRATVKSPEDIEHVIQEIQARMAAAGQKGTDA